MKRNAWRYVACSLVFGFGVASSLAQDAIWTNVVDGVVTTGSWHIAENWEANAAPVAGQDARLTNTLYSYVVEVNEAVSTYTNATLWMSNSGGNTVTLDVNENMEGGATASATTSRFTLDAGANSVVNVPAGKSLRFNTRTISSAMMQGSMNVYGTVNWHTPSGSSGHRQTKLTIYDQGAVYTRHGSAAQQQLYFGNAAQLDIQAGGLWRHEGREFNILGGPNTLFDIHGTFDFATARYLALGLANDTSATTVRVHPGGLLLLSVSNASTELKISRSTTSGANCTLIVNGGTVTNVASTFIAGHWRGELNNTASTVGVVTLTGNGQWVNLGNVLVGGIVGLGSGTTNNAANYNKVFGTLTQSNGYFRAASTLYVAEGPSQGTVTVLGGDFHVTNVSATATMHVGSMVTSVTTMPGRGTLRIAGGHVVADRLFAVNGEGYSTFLYESGALSLRESTLDLGIPLTVGDGVQPAVLNLLGGTHSSAYGYVINTNATLSVGGTGAISSAAVTGDVTLRENARLAFKFNAGGQDALAVTGTVTLPESATLELTSLDGSTPNYIPLLTATGGFTGSNPSAWDRVTVGSVTYGVIIEGNNTLVAMPPKKGTMILLR